MFGVQVFEVDGLSLVADGELVDLAAESLEVRDMADVGTEGVSLEMVFLQTGQGILSTPDLVRLQERSHEPLPEQTRRHWGLADVQVAVETAFQWVGWSGQGGR